MLGSRVCPIGEGTFSGQKSLFLHISHLISV
jgi:hypothetical protein